MNLLTQTYQWVRNDFFWDLGINKTDRKKKRAQCL